MESLAVLLGTKSYRVVPREITERHDLFPETSGLAPDPIGTQPSFFGRFHVLPRKIGDVMSCVFTWQCGKA